MELVAIAAVSENNVIGKNGEIPWTYPVDLKHFHNTVNDSPTIVGRKTYESMPSLSGTSIVLTSNSEYDVPDKDIVATSVEEALNKIEQIGSKKKTNKELTVYIVGGETIYKQFFSYTDKLIITHIPYEYDGDSYFPEFSTDKWVKEKEEDKYAEFTICHYSRLSEEK